VQDKSKSDAAVISYFFFKKNRPAYAEGISDNTLSDRGFTFLLPNKVVTQKTKQKKIK